MRRIDPNRIVLEMFPMRCPTCNNIQHVWFSSQIEHDNWDCPICRKVEGILPEGKDDEHSTTKSD